MHSLARLRTGITVRQGFAPLALFVLLLGFCLSGTLLAQSPNEALFNADEVNDMAAVETAIAAGADLTAKNAKGMTPADVAVDLGHFRIAHILLSKRTTPPTAASKPRVTEKVKEALVQPTARVATPGKPVKPDPRLSVLTPPKKPDAVPAVTPPSPESKPAPAASVAKPAPPTVMAPDGTPPAPMKKAPPEPRPDDEIARATPKPAPAQKAKADTAGAAKEDSFFGNLWGNVKDVVTLGGLLGGDQTQITKDDRRLKSPEGVTLSNPADRFSSQPPTDKSDSAAGRMVDRMKDMVGSDNTAENSFGLPTGPVVPPLPPGQNPLVTPPGVVSVETAERAPALAPPALSPPGLAPPALETPGLAAPALEAPTLGAPAPGQELTLEVPGLAAPTLPPTGPGKMAAAPSKSIEVPGLPGGLSIPGLPDGPAPPDPQIPGLPGGMDIPGVASEVPGIIAPPAAPGTLPALPPGLEPLPGSETGALRRPGGLIQPSDPTSLPPPATGSLQDQLKRIDRILSRDPIQNSERYLTPRTVPQGGRNDQPQPGTPRTAPAKPSVETKKAPDPMLEIPKGLEGNVLMPVPKQVEAYDPAEILRRARESEAVLKERAVHENKPGKNAVNVPRPLRPSGHQLPIPDKAHHDQAGTGLPHVRTVQQHRQRAAG